MTAVTTPPLPKTSPQVRAVAPSRVSFKAQMLQAREDAIVQAVIRLLGEKGFDAMTVDEVAAAVGIAKASLYTHFSGKEDLAAAAMVHVMRRAQAFLQSLPRDQAPLGQLRAVVRWMMELQLANEMPSLPSRNSTLRATLMANTDYTDGLMEITDQLGAWIEAAQGEGTLDPALPPLVVLYTLYARACDPVPEFLQASGLYTDAQTIDLMLRTCFNGLGTR